MKKVCHITTVHPSRYDDRIFEKECVSLAAAGYDTTLIVNDDLPDEVINGVKIISLRTGARSRIDRAVRISNIAYRKALDVDAEIYHIHDPELLKIAVRLQKNGKKVLFDSHEFTAEQIKTKYYIPGFIRGLVSKIYKGYERKCLRQISGMIVPCLYEGRDYFEDIDIDRVIIDNRPVLSKYSGEFYDVDERENSVCYIGTISESRGAVQMVKASGLSGVRLVLIGSMSEDLQKELESMPEYKNVDYLGEMKHEEAMRVASKSKVGLSLLHDEGQYSKIDNLPVKLYEYMMMGLPSVVSAFPYYKKVLEKYRFGVAVDPMNEEEIASAIIEIINDETMQHSMAQAGKDAVNKEMNWDIEAEKLFALYERI